MQRPAHILVIIIVSQFAGTSLWFAGNAILPELQSTFHLDKHAVSSITSAVQFGFISGTFVFAFLSIADRLSPSFVFFVSSVLASTSNWLVLYVHDVNLLFSLRFLTGFFLAGIYPVGMKIAADWYEKDLGKALGYLVGALVVGTAFPHLLKGDLSLPWKSVITTTSLFALGGGIIILLFVADGPSRRKAGQFQPGRLFHAFTIPRFRAAAFGYFGHMWELYTVWAFLPSIIMLHNKLVPPPLNIPLSSFFAIAAGAVGCVVGGWLSKRIGSKRVAFYALAISGCCCTISPWMIASSNVSFLAFIMLWGIAVAADSPQFSALVASAAPAEEKGTAMTIVISIGFAITIVSLYVTDQLYHRFVDSTNIYALLFIGPVLGLVLMAPLLRNNQSKVLKPAA